MHPTDQTFYNAMTQVVAHSLKRSGMNIDDQAMDWGTVVQRRASKEPLDKGGWSLFIVGVPGGRVSRSADGARPCAATARQPGSAGPTTRRSRNCAKAWLDATDPAERSKLDAALQVQAFESVPFVPLGQ